MNTIHNPSVAYIELSILILIYLCQRLELLQDSYKTKTNITNFPKRMTQYRSLLGSNFKHLFLFYTYY